MVLTGCYTSRIYVKDFNGGYAKTTEAVLNAIGKQGARVKRRADVGKDNAMYVVGTGLWDAGIWGREVCIEVRKIDEHNTEVSFLDMYYTQKADWHKEIFSFIESYIKLNFEE
jgi:hypothetical protein